jgi:hypothetical protein
MKLTTVSVVVSIGCAVAYLAFYYFPPIENGGAFDVLALVVVLVARKYIDLFTLKVLQVTIEGTSKTIFKSTHLH